METIHPIEGNPILESIELSWPWATIDPFLLCSPQIDHYPPGNTAQKLDAEHLQGHRRGNDFANADGFSLYFGKDGLPGFPSHPHLGMETVSILRKGYVDHADSLGNSGRYGPGDVQWMTAGGGIQHAEMFPLLHDDRVNEFELFQIWLNMPGRSKYVAPEYRMMWAEKIPHHVHEGADVTIIAGAYQPMEAPGLALIQPLAPTQSTWAANPDSELAIWVITLQPGARLTLPPAQLQANQRTLYTLAGRGMFVAEQDVGGNHRIRVVAQQALLLENRGAKENTLILMQGVPLQEPAIRSTVYVTNTIAEMRQAKLDFQHTEFGGWPWPGREPMHGPGFRRFAKYAEDGSEEDPAD